MKKWFKRLIKESIAEDFNYIKFRLIDVNEELKNEGVRDNLNAHMISKQLDEIIMHLDHIRRT